jgi:hypothetical protein
LRALELRLHPVLLQGLACLRLFLLGAPLDRPKALCPEKIGALGQMPSNH